MSLVTRDDPMHMHKLLGLFCFLHALYRFAVSFVARDMGFQTDSTTLACVAAHACLSLSSLIFALPKRRIRDGSRIWPQYRLHSIIFACRSLCFMLLVLYIKLNTISRPPNDCHKQSGCKLIYSTYRAAPWGTFRLWLASKRNVVAPLAVAAAAATATDAAAAGQPGQPRTQSSCPRHASLPQPPKPSTLCFPVHGLGHTFELRPSPPAADTVASFSPPSSSAFAPFTPPVASLFPSPSFSPSP